MRCEECNEEAVYLIEWRGFEAKKYYSCTNPEHLISLSDPRSLGYPNMIYDANQHIKGGKQRRYEYLRESVIDAIENPESKACMEELARVAARPFNPYQLNLSLELRINIDSLSK